MKTILSALVALSVITAIAAPASAFGLRDLPDFAQEKGR
jgi:hypothetical protein